MGRVLEHRPPLFLLSPIVQVGLAWEHPPPLLFLSPIIQVGGVWEHPPPLLFLSLIIQVGGVWEHPPPLFSFSNHLSGSCLEAPSPSVFFLNLFKCVEFGSTIPLCFGSQII